MSDLVAIIDALAAKVQAHASGTLPTRTRYYLYQQHRGITAQDVPALEVYPTSSDLETVATDGTTAFTPSITLAWHSSAQYGAETGDRAVDERVASTGLEYAEAVVHALLDFGATFEANGITYVLDLSRMVWRLTEGLTWSCEIEVEVEYLQ